MSSKTQLNFSELSKEPDRIRNIAVIAHVDHGKTTLSDSLLARAGVLPTSQAGDKRGMDTRPDERTRGITIKSTGVSLAYRASRWDMRLLKNEEVEEDGPEFLVNLIDSPGHVDFSPEVSVALRVSDGALLVVDCISGVAVQTKTVLKQALHERVQPVLVLNKLDRAILEQQMQAEDIYLKLKSTVDEVNALIQTYSDWSAGDLHPVLGNVAFASGVQGWAFTLHDFVWTLLRNADTDKSDMLLKRLWGEHYYNPTNKKWSTSPKEGSRRGFCVLVLEPLARVLRACKEVDRGTLLEMVEKLELPAAVRTQINDDTSTAKTLPKSVVGAWLPAGDTLFRLVVSRLPSPVQAQRLRASLLYEGPLEDPVGEGLLTCNRAAPLLFYVSKMAEASNGQFFAFGRVFSGTLTAGKTVQVLEPNYVPGGGAAPREAKVQKVVIMMADKTQSVDEVPCGAVAGLLGLDKHLTKTGTLTSYPLAHNIRSMKFSVSPVMRVAVSARQPADLPKLVEGLRRLAKSDPMVQVLVDEQTGQHVVAGTGELHLEVCMKDLEERFAKVGIVVSEALISYRETVLDAVDLPVLAKSTSKLNRVFVTARPLPSDLVEAIESGQISHADSTARAKALVQRHSFDKDEAKKVWSQGPENSSNLLTDNMKGVQCPKEVKDSLIAGFQWATQEGPLCEERMLGVHFGVTDLMSHSDPAHRKASHILPMARRAFLGAAMTARPALVEPIYEVDVETASDSVGAIYTVLSKRRGVILEEKVSGATGTGYLIRAHLPVNESLGLTEELRGAAHGQAFPQCRFSHWAVMPGDPVDPESKPGRIVRQIRARKGLNSTNPPQAGDFLDKL